MANICLFCGSRTSNDPEYVEAAKRFGEEIAKRGWGLVYGGGDSGLMGAAADAVLAAGGKVIGIIPPYLLETEGDRTDLTERYIVETLAERKQMMADLSDGFVAMPGGVGTLDELTEAWTWYVLGLHNKPVGIYNVKGFYNKLIEFFENMVSLEITGAAYMNALTISENLDELLDTIAQDENRRLSNG